MVRHSLAVVCIAALLHACATRPGDEIVDKEVRVSVDGADLIYNGQVTPEANSRLFAAAESGARNLRRLAITSPGGEIDAGIELGEWVFDQGFDVYVPEYCLSSCANYVFPAGKGKFLNSNAVLFWHGGALQEQPKAGSLCAEVEWTDKTVDCDEVQLRTLINRNLPGTTAALD